jgi:hypothetical protein
MRHRVKYCAGFRRAHLAIMVSRMRVIGSSADQITIRPALTGGLLMSV